MGIVEHVLLTETARYVMMLEPHGSLAGRAVGSDDGLNGRL